MKPIFTFFFAAIMLSLTVSCNRADRQDKKAEEDLTKEVLALHDEVMSKTDQLVQLETKLKNLVTKSTPEAKASTDSVLVMLTMAENDMMDWMNQYNDDHNGKSHKEIMDYLSTQKSKLDQIKKSTEMAILKGAAQAKVLEPTTSK
jgi:hypothetical protein